MFVLQDWLSETEHKFMRKFKHISTNMVLQNICKLINPKYIFTLPVLLRMARVFGLLTLNIPDKKVISLSHVKRLVNLTKHLR